MTNALETSSGQAPGEMSALEGGFAEAPVQSARAFRAVLEAMARPGRIETVAGAQAPGLSVAGSVVLATLVDRTTPVFLAPGLDAGLPEWLAFHTGAPITGPSHCMFALGTWDALGPLSSYPIGTSEYPDRSATLIVECADLAADGATLTGPGIRNTASLSLPETQAFQDNAALFPLGLDFVFTSDDRIAALPRSTKVSRSSSEAVAQEGNS